MNNRISKLLVIVFMVILSGAVSAEVKNTRPKIDPDVLGYPTGNIEPTPEELKAWKLGATRIEKVRMSALGIERINQVRKNKGLPELPIKRLRKQVKDNFDLINNQMAEPPGDLSLDETSYTLGDIPPPGMADNSLLDAFPPVRSQSGGSCTAWGNTYYMMTHMTSLARGWDAKNGGDYYHFSLIYTCSIITGF